MRTTVLTTAARLGFIILGLVCWAMPVRAAGLSATKVADNGSYGCRRSFGYGVYDPAAGKTVVIWNGDKMGVYVKAYDHGAGQWSSAVKAKALSYTSTYDYHNYPTIVIAPDGHYLIFYHKHSTAAYMLRSPAAHSIEGTWEYSTVNTDRNAYPMPAVVDGSVYLFYSRSDNISSAYRSYRYTRSDDNGSTWSTPRAVIDTRDTDPDKYDEVYLHGFAVDEANNRILLGWEMHGGPNGHNKGGKNAYFAAFDCEADKMYSAAGTDLGSTIDLTELLGDCLVAEGADETGIPFGYTTFPELLPGGNPGVLYRYNGTTYLARWTGSAWSRSSLSGIGSPTDYQRDGAGNYYILNRSGTTLEVWRSANGYSGWVKDASGSFAHENGSTSYCAGFIDAFRPGVQCMAATYNSAERTSDYSGTWPVVVLGTEETVTDDTPPTAPQNLRMTARSESTVTLTWNAASDGESGIARYRVYRDGTKLGIAAGTAFTDTGLAEAAAYTYRVSAVNGAGLESVQSTALACTTVADDTAPEVTTVRALGATSVFVAFSEPVAAADAVLTANYAMDNGISVTAAEVSGNGMGARLTVDAMTADVEYTLTVSGIHDRAVSPNTMRTATVTFTYYDSYMDNFDDVRLDWTPLTSSRWSVDTDGADDAYHITTSEYDPAGDNPGAMALLDGVNAADFRLEVAVRSPEPSSNGYPDAGVVFGYTGPDDFYYFLANGDPVNNQLFRVVAGIRTSILDLDEALLADNDYHTLTVSVRSGTVAVAWDGTVRGAVAEDVPAGQVGLCSYNDEVWFDDFVLTPIDNGSNSGFGMRTEPVLPGYAVDDFELYALDGTRVVRRKGGRGIFLQVRRTDGIMRLEPVLMLE